MDVFELESGWARRCVVQTIKMLKRTWFWEIVCGIVVFSIYCAIAQLPSAIQCIGNIVAYLIMYLRTAIYAADDRGYHDLSSILAISKTMNFSEIFAAGLWFWIFNIILNIAIGNVAVLANQQLLGMFSWPHLSNEQMIERAAGLMIYQTGMAIVYVNIYHSVRFLLELQKVQTLRAYLDVHWSLLFVIACRAVFRRDYMASAVMGHILIIGLTILNIFLSLCFLPIFYLFGASFMFCFSRELFTGRTTSREPKPKTVGNLVPVVS